MFDLKISECCKYDCQTYLNAEIADLQISKFYPVQQKIWIGTIFAWLSLFVVVVCCSYAVILQIPPDLPLKLE